MVSAHDKAKMRSIAASLTQAETTQRGTPAERRQMLDHINSDRARHGAPPLLDRAPEEGFYDRARSLGMARIDR